jgi:hypothetical protein
MYDNDPATCKARAAWLDVYHGDRTTRQQNQQKVAQECRATCGSCIDNKAEATERRSKGSTCDATFTVNVSLTNPWHVVQYSLYTQSEVEVEVSLVTSANGAVVEQWFETVFPQNVEISRDHNAQQYLHRFKAQEFHDTNEYELRFVYPAGHDCTRPEQEQITIGSEYVSVYEDAFQDDGDCSHTQVCQSTNADINGKTCNDAYIHFLGQNTAAKAARELVDQSCDMCSSCRAAPTTTTTAQTVGTPAMSDFESPKDGDNHYNFIGNVPYSQQDVNRGTDGKCIDDDWNSVLEKCAVICRGDSNCKAFFYQEHPNNAGCEKKDGNKLGWQICSFYTSEQVCETTNYVRHGHREGSQIAIKKDSCPVVGTPPVMAGFESPKDNSDNHYNFIGNVPYNQDDVNRGDGGKCIDDDWNIVLEKCAAKCKAESNCKAFFYQEHPNNAGCEKKDGNKLGWQICSFYTSDDVCTTGNYSRHGHRKGSQIAIKRDTCSRRLDSIFV